MQEKRDNLDNNEKEHLRKEDNKRKKEKEITLMIMKRNISERRTTKEKRKNEITLMIIRTGS